MTDSTKALLERAEKASKDDYMTAMSSGHRYQILVLDLCEALRKAEADQKANERDYGELVDSKEALIKDSYEAVERANRAEWKLTVVEAERDALKEQLAAFEKVSDEDAANAYAERHQDNVRVVASHEKLARRLTETEAERDRLGADARQRFLTVERLEAENEKLAAALRDMEQFCTWLCEDSNKYPGTDAGNLAKSKRVDVRKVLAALPERKPRE